MPNSLLSDEIKLEITFFVRHEVDQDAIIYLGKKAEEAGFDTEITQDLTADAEIGIYTASPGAVPKINSKLSVKMFHGIDSGYSPHRWKNDDWGKFDIGLLPGEASAENWRSQSINPRARPRFGVFTVGWPKSDYVFTDDFEKDLKEFRSNLDLAGDKTVLYAPVRECYGKVFDFIESLEDTVDNLLIKHGPVDRGRSLDNYESLEELYNELRKYDHVHILNPDDSIYLALSLSDILVSDNSSVLLDAAVTETVPVKITNWPIKRNNLPPKKNIYPDFVLTSKSNELQQTVDEIYNNYSDHLEHIDSERTYHYSNLGCSSTITLSLINNIVNNEILPTKAVNPKEKSKINYNSKLINLYSERMFINLKSKAAMSLNDKQKEKLDDIGVTSVVDKIESLFRFHHKK